MPWGSLVLRKLDSHSLDWPIQYYTILLSILPTSLVHFFGQADGLKHWSPDIYCLVALKCVLKKLTSTLKVFFKRKGLVGHR